MYYSFNNEKKPSMSRNLPDIILGTYIQPKLVGRKVKALQNTPIKPRLKMPIKLDINIRRQSIDMSYKFLSRQSLNNPDEGEGEGETNKATNIVEEDNIGYNYNLKSFHIAPVNTVSLLPLIETKTSLIKKSDTLDRDYIKTEEPLISRYKLQNLGLKNMYKNIVKNSLKSLSISKFNKYEGYT
jgi:hypothetical protein